MRSDRHKNKNSKLTQKRTERKTVSEDKIDYIDKDKSIEKEEVLFDRSAYGDFDEKELIKAEKKFQRELKKKNKSRGKKYSKNISDKKSKKTWLKVLIVLVLLVAVCAGGFFFYLHTKINKMDLIDTTPAEFDVDPKVEKELSDYRNVAILGIDARKGEGFKGSRSDAIIIASINKRTNEVNLISILRDSHLYMDNGYGQMVLDKVTHAHAFGGAVNTCSTLNRSLDLNISEFIVMDWNSVADVVDIFGGLTINVKSNEIRDLNKWGPETALNTNRQWHMVTQTGEQKLDGAQVATYCRIRKTSGGDTGRTTRMKKVTKALLKEALANPMKIDSVLDKVLPEIQTNMGTGAFTTLLPKIATFNIQKSIGWPYEYYGGIINGKWLAVPRTLESNVKKLHKQAFGQDNYVLSQQAGEIAQIIINQTGVQ
ncbi:MAG: LCP family protein [Anaerovoracaceae bacterium]